MPDEDFLGHYLQQRQSEDALRTLRRPAAEQVDFCSNDYLGLARDMTFQETIADAVSRHGLSHGSGGSRLLAGNYALAEETEAQIAQFHQAEAALVFNSGYDANVGLFSSLPHRGDIVLYDRLIHASIRDGIRLSPARAFAFAHNDAAHLEQRLKKLSGRVFVAVESIYSMDGDRAPLEAIAEVCGRYGAHLIVDEAHATGVVGDKGEGLVQQLGLQERCLARVHTFGKALGVHGAAVTGSRSLRYYLLNFARSFIYTTALPPAAMAGVQLAYNRFPEMRTEREQLSRLMAQFDRAALPCAHRGALTPIQGIIVPGNAAVKRLATALQSTGMDVRPVLSPTVPAGSERLRVVLHSFNTLAEVERLTATLQQYLKTGG
ncbi:8-amino-7-oxononanoate synthase [Compostibacter hankyongensis]|uniref:Pyridoxal phosphate-dependent aminotransferase family protein n=1 Tax=Compostibacter hankyongensis TaxID=1007089 RepID=A0ABP8G6L6_9BACT